MSGGGYHGRAPLATPFRSLMWGRHAWGREGPRRLGSQLGSSTHRAPIRRQTGTETSTQQHKTPRQESWTQQTRKEQKQAESFIHGETQTGCADVSKPNNTPQDAIKKKEMKNKDTQSRTPATADADHSWCRAWCHPRPAPAQPPCSRAASAADSPNHHHTGAGAAAAASAANAATPLTPNSITEKMSRHARSPPSPPHPAHESGRVGGGTGNKKAQPARLTPARGACDGRTRRVTVVQIRRQLRGEPLANTLPRTAATATPARPPAHLPKCPGTGS